MSVDFLLISSIFPGHLSVTNWLVKRWSLLTLFLLFLLQNYYFEMALDCRFWLLYVFCKIVFNRAESFILVESNSWIKCPLLKRGPLLDVLRCWIANYLHYYQKYSATAYGEEDICAQKHSSARKKKLRIPTWCFGTPCILPNLWLSDQVLCSGPYSFSYPTRLSTLMLLNG